MRHIPEQGSAGVIRSREIVAVVKQPAEPGVGIKILIRKPLPPPGKIISGLKAAGQ